MMPPVSIIIPTFNSGRILGKCLNSIKEQSYPKGKIELIIVDNFSKDNTVDISKKYTSKIFLKGPERHKQRAYGVEKSKGKYLMFIDSDMELDMALVEEAVNLCEKKGFDAVILPEQSTGDGFWANCRKLEKKCYLNDELMETPNRFIKRNVYLGIGGYDRELITGEDFDLGDRIKEKGHSVGRANSYIHHHEVRTFWQMLKKHYYYGKEMKKYFKKSKATGVKRFFIFRSAYFRNWRLFAQDPLHGSGLIFMKVLQYSVAFLGIMRAAISDEEPAPSIHMKIDQENRGGLF